MQSNYKYFLDKFLNAKSTDGGYKLERVQEAFTKLGEQDGLGKIIHIAGTNGKGSVANMCYATLKNAGYTVGITTSPHIVDVFERWKCTNGAMTQDEFVTICKKLFSLGIDLSFFEYSILIALEFFKLRKCEYVVLEVGLGGRLDATNIIMPTVTAITSISRDHEHILGDTLKKISAEKAGIIKQGIPLVLAEKNETIETIAREKNAPLFFSSPQKTNLLGDFQEKNAGIAYEIAKILQIPEKTISEGLQKVVHRGRLEFIEKNILIDGAHNEDSLKKLYKFICSIKKDFDDIFYCVSLKKGKQITGIFEIMGTEYNYAIVKSNNPMLENQELLCMQASEFIKNCSVLEAEEIQQKAKNNPTTLFVVFGSLYMIGEFYKNEQKNSHNLTWKQPLR